MNKLKNMARASIIIRCCFFFCWLIKLKYMKGIQGKIKVKFIGKRHRSLQQKGHGTETTDYKVSGFLFGLSVLLVNLLLVLRCPTLWHRDWASCLYLHVTCWWGLPHWGTSTKIIATCLRLFHQSGRSLTSLFGVVTTRKEKLKAESGNDNSLPATHSFPGAHSLTPLSEWFF